jgi:hypothetical protein
MSRNSLRTYIDFCDITREQYKTLLGTSPRLGTIGRVATADGSRGFSTHVLRHPPCFSRPSRQRRLKNQALLRDEWQFSINGIETDGSTNINFPPTKTRFCAGLSHPDYAQPPALQLFCGPIRPACGRFSA